MTKGLLMAGGANDPNICCLLEAALVKGIPVSPFLIEEDSSPSFFWDMNKNELLLGGKVIRALAAFVRRDVFHGPGIIGHDRSLAWYNSLIGWIAVHPEVNIFNRSSISTYTNKLWVLKLAAKAGLLVPATYVTNNIESIQTSNKEMIAKPVMGGGYCHKFNSIVQDTEIKLGLTANPAIVQQQIKGEDIRIYRVDHQYIGFSILAECIDYRRASEYEIKIIDKIPKGVTKCLSKLMDQIGLNWGAADFKKSDTTGKWYFLEVNSDPMFSVFDRKAEGKISDSILQSLLTVPA